MAGTAAASEKIPPSILGESASGITPTNATLEASIVPGHWRSPTYDPEADWGAYYQFQLAIAPTEFRPEVSCPAQGEVPVICTGPAIAVANGFGKAAGSIERLPGDLPTNWIDGELEPQDVSLDLAEIGRILLPGMTYHYRVIVVPTIPTVDTIQWEGPPIYGADRTFTTPLTESEGGEEEGPTEGSRDEGPAAAQGPAGLASAPLGTESSAGSSAPVERKRRKCGRRGRASGSSAPRQRALRAHGRARSSCVRVRSGR